MDLRGFQDFTKRPIKKLLPVLFGDGLELSDDLVALEYALSLGLKPTRTRNTST